MRAAVTVVSPIPSPTNRMTFFARVGFDPSRTASVTAARPSSCHEFPLAQASWVCAPMAAVLAIVAMLRDSAIRLLHPRSTSQ